MPGLAGTTRSGAAGEQLAGVMAQMLVHRPWHGAREVETAARGACVFVDDSSMSIGGTCRRSELTVWASGEVYEAGGIQAGPALAELIADEYENDSMLSGLGAHDGVFCAVIVDGRRNEVHLVTDLLGLRWLAWAGDSTEMHWSTEVKSHLAVGPKPLSERAGRDLLVSGQLSGDSTWFDDVKLLPAGGHVVFRPGCAPTVRRYAHWEWLRVELPKSERAVEAHLASAITAAVTQRCQGNYGIPLSGGLDSRVLVAAASPRPTPLHTVCFGQRGAVDSILASRVAAVAKTCHHNVLLTEANWLNERQKSVWATDGHFDVTHMQLLAGVQELRGRCDSLLDGFLGDALLGGTYLKRSQRVQLDGCGEVELVNQRGRRYINEGRRLVESLVAVDRAPLVARNLIAISLSLREDQRADGRVYHSVLRHAFPDYFRTIPWQATLVPLGWPSWTSALAREALRQAEARRAPWHQCFSDYPAWLRGQAASEMLEREVVGNSELDRWMAAGERRALWDRHVAGKDCTSGLLRLLTVAWWQRAVAKVAA